MWTVLFDKDCFLLYLMKVLNLINSLSMWLLLFLPFILLVPFLFCNIVLRPNENTHGKKSRSIIYCEKKIIPFFHKVKAFCSDLVLRFLNKKIYFLSFLICWFVNFNIFTLIFEILAYYFYFVFSFDFKNLFTIQLVKLLLDILIMFSGAPIIFWVIVVYIILSIIRKNIGYKRLNFREGLDRAFMKKLSILLMFTGTIGTGKTTALTSFGLSQEIEFRNVALEKMMEIDSKYPNFPWIILEDELKRAIKYGQIKNLTQCRIFIDKKRRRFSNDVCKEKIFGYDFDTYRISYDNNLLLTDIWSDLSNYSCLYFIYIIQSSLLIANLSVRSDNEIQDIGNFPLWDTELFRNSPLVSSERSRRAHILDYDVFRLGRQLLDENPRRGSFEFGVVLLSEFAKERGNKITNEGIKKGDDNTNQKNDLFTYSLKMARHKATICGYPFIRFIADEQRPTSLEADTRELMSIVHIEKKNSTELLMPMFFIEELIHDLFYPKFINFYVEYRYNRGDTSFLMYLLHNIMSVLHNYYIRVYNLFGYNVLEVAVQDGKMEAEAEKAKIHLLHKKVYSDRFATDCYNGFFVPELAKSNYSFDSYLEYMETVASREELKFQNSYFINDLVNISKSIDSENKNA